MTPAEEKKLRKVKGKGKGKKKKKKRKYRNPKELTPE
jgi:hypothetical protein